MTPIIRRLGPGDTEALRAHNRLYREAFEEPEVYDSNPPSDGFLGARLADANFIALDASADGRCVGAITAYLLHKIEQERSEIYLYDLAVAADHRRQGIATALIEALRGVAREAGAWTIFVQADADDAPALALYNTLACASERPTHFDIAP